MFEGEGHEVIIATDGLQGLLQIEIQHPDLVVLDLMMPNISGDRVLREIQEDPRLSAVPVIVVSGRHDVRETFDPLLGAENVFEKPFEPSKLIERVAEILG